MNTPISQANRHFQAFHGLPMSRTFISDFGSTVRLRSHVPCDGCIWLPWHGSVHRQSTDTSSYSQLKVKVGSRWHLHTSLDMSNVASKHFTEDLKTKSCKLLTQICQVKPSIKAMNVDSKYPALFQWQEANISTPGSFAHGICGNWILFCHIWVYVRSIHVQIIYRQYKTKSVCATWQLSSQSLHSQQSTPHPVIWKLKCGSCFFMLHALGAFCRKSSLSVGSAHFQHWLGH